MAERLEILNFKRRPDGILEQVWQSARWHNGGGQRPLTL
jgi:hypothetical protein